MTSLAFITLLIAIPTAVVLGLIIGSLINGISSLFSRSVDRRRIVARRTGKPSKIAGLIDRRNKAILEDARMLDQRRRRGETTWPLAIRSIFR